MKSNETSIHIEKINNKDKYLIKKILDYEHSYPEKMNFLRVPINHSTGHINFLESIFSKYEKEKDNLGHTDILSSEHKNIVKEWEFLLRAAIACLRRHDTREPFQETTDRVPTAYGVEKIEEFYTKFIDFEGILYGADRWYRDHVMHAYRVWLLGMDLLTCKVKNEQSNSIVLSHLVADNIVDIKQIKDGKHSEERRQPEEVKGLGGEKEPEEEKIKFTYTEPEVYSMWTIVALTHDLGYPLQKAPKLLAKINEMMTYFIISPNMNYDLNFSTAADTVNDYIVRLISSKMILKSNFEKDKPKKKVFSGRIQPKFYMKFLKSLEFNAHGIISSILLYKNLVFFLESECNINEDYLFDHEEARQFYIRREILRAIATHTCSDIYLMHVSNLSCLLYICDELQEWGRNKFYKSILDTICFVPPTYELESISKIHIKQHINFAQFEADKIYSDQGLIEIIKRIKNDHEKYKRVFRDGIDTNSRSFSFIKNTVIGFTNKNIPKLRIKSKIPKNAKATLKCFCESNSEELKKILKNFDIIQQQPTYDQYNSFDLP